MSTLATAILAATVAALGTNPTVHGAGEPQEATLRFVSSEVALVGISFGLDAVDQRALLLDQRTSTQLAAGRRTIWFTCPNEPATRDGSRLTFDFVPGKSYELSCGSGQAQIRIAEGC
ncbi:MAG: hypothetical protein ACREO3_09295 [Arenimonas sp.]